eukprot:747747-Hanusia_phi.AAC.5
MAITMRSMEARIVMVLHMAVGLVVAVYEGKSEMFQENAFLGGKYIQLGFKPTGKLGTDVQPADLYSRQGLSPAVWAGGMSLLGDADGFGEGADLRIDYFLPGSPAEGFRAGYRLSPGGNETEGDNFAHMVYNASFPPYLSAVSVALVGDLSVEIEASFHPDDFYFLTRAKLKNTGSNTLHDVRYMRYADPDNTVDMGGSFTTINQIICSKNLGQPCNAISAESYGADDPYLDVSPNRSTAVVFYYTTDNRARMFTGMWNLNIYNPQVYDRAPNSTSQIADDMIYITFDVGTLAPGEEKVVEYYTVAGFGPPKALLREFESSLAAAAFGSQCQLTKNWDELISHLSQRDGIFFTGGMGKLLTPSHQVWVCQKEHPCAVELSKVVNDSFCFVYNENTTIFEPWGLNSYLNLL